MRLASWSLALVAGTFLGAVSVGLLARASADGDGARPSAVSAGEYIGADGCKKCHFKPYKEWKKTPHADAFDKLPEKYKSDSKCLTCHTTGHGQPGGFAGDKKLAGVQCEMCHGPGKAHADYMKANEAKKEDAAVLAEGKKLIGGDRGKSVCWLCHLDQTHGSHPEFDK